MSLQARCRSAKILCCGGRTELHELGRYGASCWAAWLSFVSPSRWRIVSGAYQMSDLLMYAHVHQRSRYSTGMSRRMAGRLRYPFFILFNRQMSDTRLSLKLERHDSDR